MELFPIPFSSGELFISTEGLYSLPLQTITEVQAGLLREESKETAPCKCVVPAYLSYIHTHATPARASEEGQEDYGAACSVLDLSLVGDTAHAMRIH